MDAWQLFLMRCDLRATHRSGNFQVSTRSWNKLSLYYTSKICNKIIFTVCINPLIMIKTCWTSISKATKRCDTSSDFRPWPLILVWLSPFRNFGFLEKVCIRCMFKNIFLCKKIASYNEKSTKEHIFAHFYHTFQLNMRKWCMLTFYAISAF